MKRHIHVFGYPSAVGGASTELWHLIKLWRRNDCAVTLIPTWSVPKGWQTQTEAIGCQTLLMDQHNVALPDESIVVSLCNTPFLAVSGRLRNCRLTYLPCMTYLNAPLESQVYREERPFAAYVFQSRHQHDALTPGLSQLGVPSDRFHVIPGAFDVAEFPFRPCHRNGDPFTFGRISRPDPRKFRSDWWQFCGQVRDRLPVDARCRTLGWHAIAARKCGSPPAWCEALAKCSEPVADFLGSLHCLVQLGDADENWSRVGLEAMAAGVPIVADRRGGWCEMIRDGQTGFLASTTYEAVDAVLGLASNEAIRLEIAERARIAVEDMANGSVLWGIWKELFNAIGA